MRLKSIHINIPINRTTPTNRELPANLELPANRTAAYAGAPSPLPASPIPDYGSYTLAPRERLLFNTLGYVFLAVFVFLFYHSLLLAGITGFAIRKCQPLYEKHLARKRQEELNLQFQDLLRSLSASITAGRQMSEALVEAWDNLALMYEPDAPIMTELHFMKKSIQENHESDRILLADFARRSGSEDILSFVQVYLTCRSTGGDLERVISHTSEIIADKMKINDQIRAITAQKKLEGRLISLMPAVMLLALNLLSPSYISILYSCLAGRLIMTFCLGAIVCGIVLMEKMSSVEI